MDTTVCFFATEVCWTFYIFSECYNVSHLSHTLTESIFYQREVLSNPGRFWDFPFSIWLCSRVCSHKDFLVWPNFGFRKSKSRPSVVFYHICVALFCWKTILLCVLLDENFARKIFLYKNVKNINVLFFPKSFYLAVVWCKSVCINVRLFKCVHLSVRFILKIKHFHWNC